MRPSVVITTLVCGLVILAIVVHEARLQRRLEAALTANQSLAEKADPTNDRLIELEKKIEWLRQEHPASGNMDSPGIFTDNNVGSPSIITGNNITQGRIAELEKSVQSLTKELARQIATFSVPEYDPTRPPTEIDITNSSPRRSWGEEQITGPPDTYRDGDSPTAWATLQTDAGAEWLAAGFDNPTDITEVRIRENDKPGAITKVTAMVNGQEVVLWEGTVTPGGKAPRDFVVRPNFNVTASSVVIHLDTARVSGWNEIDAVELVGRDGSRQWASSASASSTYAERETNRSEVLIMH